MDRFTAKMKVIEEIREKGRRMLPNTYQAYIWDLSPPEINLNKIEE